MSRLRRVLSFDVGIINLAYCILEIDDKNKQFKIIKWGIIDIADDRITCSFCKLNGELCDKIASYVIKLDKHNCYYYCRDHIKKANIKFHPINMKWWPVQSDNVETCCMCKKSGAHYSNMFEGQYCNTHHKTIISNHKFMCQTKKCNNIICKGLYLEKPEVDEYGNEDNETYNELEFGWCSQHFDKEYQDYIKKKTKKISQNSNKISLFSLGASMYQKLDQIPELLMVDEVLVENQPTFINPTMKSVSAILFSYFIMRGVYEKTKTKSTITDVAFCSPSNKIKVGGKSAIDKIEKTKDGDEINNKKVYKVTKNLAVKYCLALIEDNPDYLKIINSYKKKDDMADAFLHGFIMNFGQNLPEYYAEKIRSVDIESNDKEEFEVDYELLVKDSRSTLDNDDNGEDITIRMGKRKTKKTQKGDIENLNNTKSKTKSRTKSRTKTKSDPENKDMDKENNVNGMIDINDDNNLKDKNKNVSDKNKINNVIDKDIDNLIDSIMDSKIESIIETKKDAKVKIVKRR
jgi:hypothetical protein